MFSYIGSWNEPVNWEATVDLDRYLREKGGAELGLNTTRVVRHLETQNFRLYPAGETNYRDETRSLDYVSFGTTENIQAQVELVEGVYPPPADPAPDSVVDVMIHEAFASEFGIQSGEIYSGYNWRLANDHPLQITAIRIAGVWRPRDDESEYWFYRPNVFKDIMLIDEATFTDRLAPYTETEINLAVWYLVTDGTGVNTSRVDELLRRHNDTEKIADQYLPGTYIQASPEEELRPYQRIVTVLTLTLTVFSIPIVILLIAFLIMLVGLVVDGQRNETAVLRSRGASPFQAVGLTTVEGAIMGVIALVIGLALAISFTQLIGTTRSFMDFRWGGHFIVSVPPTIGSTIALAFAFTIFIRVVPTIGASRHTIVSYKMDKSRLLQRPWWQRLGVDILLIAVIGYFYYQITQQGGLIDVEGGARNISDAYNQPFVFLLPPLTIFALTLFILRFLPPVLRALAWLIQWSNSVGLLIVTRQLERSPGAYYLPLILLVTTISLGIYTASFARTIDRYLYEQQFYKIAGDMSVRVFSSSDSGMPGGGGGGGNEAPPAYMHISEFTSFPNVINATRVGEYAAKARLTSASVEGTFVGIDRAELGPVIFWRPDFAPIRLGYLTNALALQPDSVLVSREFLDKRGLDMGDLLELDVRSAGEVFRINLQIVGELDYFPRWYPESDGALFIGNLDYLFEQAQQELAHRVIARIEDGFNPGEFTRSLINTPRGERRVGTAGSGQQLLERVFLILGRRERALSPAERQQDRDQGERQQQGSHHPERQIHPHFADGLDVGGQKRQKSRRGRQRGEDARPAHRGQPTRQAVVPLRARALSVLNLGNDMDRVPDTGADQQDWQNNDHQGQRPAQQSDNPQGPHHAQHHDQQRSQRGAQAACDAEEDHTRQHQGQGDQPLGLVGGQRVELVVDNRSADRIDVQVGVLGSGQNLVNRRRNVFARVTGILRVADKFQQNGRGPAVAGNQIIEEQRFIHGPLPGQTHGVGRMWTGFDQVGDLDLIRQPAHIFGVAQEGHVSQVGNPQLKVPGQRTHPADHVRLEEIVGLDQNIDKIVVAEELAEFVLHQPDGVVLHEERLVGVVHAQGSHGRHKQGGQADAGQQHRPAPAQQPARQAGKKPGAPSSLDLHHRRGIVPGRFQRLPRGGAFLPRDGVLNAPPA